MKLENESNGRATRRKRRAEAMATRRTDELYRTQENERNAQRMATRRTDEAYSAQENERSAHIRNPELADRNHRVSTIMFTE